MSTPRMSIIISDRSLARYLGLEPDAGIPAIARRHHDSLLGNHGCKFTPQQGGWWTIRGYASDQSDFFRERRDLLAHIRTEQKAMLCGKLED